ncbi:MAG: hypothetical protein LUO89_03405, partial [Methanothrix sp.]|nr:hypothetical protein [Methanothrix sp.]
MKLGFLAIVMLALVNPLLAKARISPDLQAVLNQPGSQMTTVILQTANALTPAERDVIRTCGGIILYEFTGARMYGLRVPIQAIQPLSALGSAIYLSSNRPAENKASHLATTTGSSLVYPTGTTPGVDGAGVGIAILDSGINEAMDFADTSAGVTVKNKTTYPSRVTARRGFLGVDSGVYINSQMSLAASANAAAYAGRRATASFSMTYNEANSAKAQTLTVLLNSANNVPYSVRINGQSLATGVFPASGKINLTFSKGANIGTDKPLPAQFDPITVA